MYVFKLKNLIAGFLAITFVIVGICTSFSKSSLKTNATENTVRVPIIMYHSTLNDTSKSGKYVITPKQFEEDLNYLNNNGYTTILMQDLINYVNSNTPLPDKPAILTFDDGYYNNYVYIYPLLQKYNAKAVISLVGEYTDLYTKAVDENANYAHLSWYHCQDMLNSGLVEFQNHTYNLHKLNKGRTGCKRKSGESMSEYAKLLNSDIGSMQDKMTEYLKVTPTTFTYPFGGVSEASYDIIKNLGFSASLSCAEGINYLKGTKDELYMLKRCIRPNNKSVEDIFNQYIN